MKKASVVILLAVFIISAQSLALAATAKKTKRPVFPVDKTKKAAPAPPAKVVKPEPKVVKKAPAAVSRSALALEGGLGGGAGVIELVYRRDINKNISYSGGLGYGVGNKYGVLVLDLARLSMGMGAFSVGLGATYASYSNLVTDIPGLSGTIPNKSLFGIELMAGREFGKIGARLAYNSALGIRFSGSYEL